MPLDAPKKWRAGIEQKTLYVGVHPEPQSICLKTMIKIMWFGLSVNKWFLISVELKFVKGLNCWCHLLLYLGTIVCSTVLYPKEIRIHSIAFA